MLGFGGTTVDGVEYPAWPMLATESAVATEHGAQSVSKRQSSFSF
jgi:hypothetical protein